MNNASLELGGTNWAEKDGNILGYSVGDTSGNFSPQEFTFARGSNLSATRIDRAGLIVKGRENLLLQSNQFDTTWASINVSETGGQAGYDGTNDAWVLTDNTATNIHSLAQYGIWPNSLCTGSIYVKAGSLSKFYVSNGTSGVGVFFNLSNGSVEGVTGAVIAQSITSVGGGWYRLSVTMQSAGTFLIGAYQTFVSGNYNASTVYTGTGTGTIYIQDAQLEQGLAASPYIPTTTTSAQAGVLENTPRLNYTTGVANPYLLLEPSRTNIITNSEYLGGSDWIKSGNGTGSVPVITSNAAISPEGVQNATRVDLDLNGGTSSGDWSWVYQNFTSTGNDETFSMYVKAVDASNVGKVIAFGAVSFTAQSLTADWVRIESTSSAAVGGYGNGFRLRGTEGTSNTASFYVFGIQHEQNASYPTSYIPTYSVSATRAQDVCNKTDASGEIGQTEGTLFVDLSNVQNLDFPEITIDNNSNTDRIVLTRDATGNWGIFVASSVTTPSSNVVYSAVGGTSGKFAIAYSSIGYVLYRNGVQISTLTYGLPSALSVFRLNGRSTNDYNSIKNINQAQLYTTRLTNAELATLTTI